MAKTKKPVPTLRNIPKQPNQLKREIARGASPPKGWKPPPATENTPLNAMQLKYVKHLVEDGLNYTAAAHLAGYKHPAVVGSQLATRPHVKKAIKLAREQYAIASQMTKKRVMDGFLDAIAQAKIISDPSAQIQGWNSIAKMCGYFEPTKHKIEIDVKGKIVLEKLQSLSDEDLVKLAEGDGNVIDAEYSETTDTLALPDHTGTHDEGKLE